MALTECDQPRFPCFQIYTAHLDKSMGGKTFLIQQQGECLFQGLHGNSLPDGADPIANNGTEIYYYYNQAKPLADSILKEIVSQTGMNDHKVRQSSLALVRNTNALSILIELGYMINPSDNSKLVDKEFQKKAAKAIADGIESFLKI